MLSRIGREELATTNLNINFMRKAGNGHVDDFCRILKLATLSSLPELIAIWSRTNRHPVDLAEKEHRS